MEFREFRIGNKKQEREVGLPAKSQKSRWPVRAACRLMQAERQAWAWAPQGPLKPVHL